MVDCQASLGLLVEAVSKLHSSFLWWLLACRVCPKVGKPVAGPSVWPSNWGSPRKVSSSSTLTITDGNSWKLLETLGNRKPETQIPNQDINDVDRRHLPAANCIAAPVSPVPALSRRSCTGWLGQAAAGKHLGVWWNTVTSLCAAKNFWPGSEKNMKRKQHFLSHPFTSQPHFGFAI